MQTLQVLLLASRADDLRQRYREGEKTNVGLLNSWLEQISGKPGVRFEKVGSGPGVFEAKTTNVDKQQLVDQFRTIQWKEPDITVMMVRTHVEGSRPTQESFYVDPNKKEK